MNPRTPTPYMYTLFAAALGGTARAACCALTLAAASTHLSVELQVLMPEPPCTPGPAWLRRDARAVPYCVTHPSSRPLPLVLFDFFL